MPGLMSWFQAADTEVCICGIGARTPLGFNAAASAAAVRGGISAVCAHPVFVDKTGEPMCLATDAELGAAVPISERIQQMLQSAIDEALDENLPVQLRSRMRCFLGVAEKRPGLTESLTLDIGRSLSSVSAFGLRPSAVQVLPFGHSSGLMGIDLAARAIAAGEVEVCLVAGTDSYHDPTTLKWLDRAGRLMSAENRNGFPPGEAASACLLASGQAARRYGLPVLGQITAVATSVEPHSIHSEAICTGEALTAALKQVTAGLDLPGEAITATYCDLNGERYRNEEFVYTLLRVQEAFVDAHDYVCPADCWGDVGAASGPLFLALAVAAVDRGYAAGGVPLLWAGSDSGYRSAVVLNLRGRSGTEDRL